MSASSIVLHGLYLLDAGRVDANDVREGEQMKSLFHNAEVMMHYAASVSFNICTQIL